MAAKGRQTERIIQKVIMFDARGLSWSGAQWDAEEDEAVPVAVVVWMCFAEHTII